MGSTWLWGVAEDAVARSEISNQFFERAVALAAQPSVRSVSIDTIQYLLLASQYLQGTQKSSKSSEYPSVTKRIFLTDIQGQTWVRSLLHCSVRMID